MLLFDCEIGSVYYIRDILVSKLKLRLLGFGFAINEKIEVVKKDKAMCICYVCDSFFCLNKQIANKIEVELCKNI